MVVFIGNYKLLIAQSIRRAGTISQNIAQRYAGVMRPKARKNMSLTPHYSRPTATLIDQLREARVKLGDAMKHVARSTRVVYSKHNIC